MIPTTLRDIADACLGELRGCDPAATVSGVATDTRDLRPGEVFVALKGETHDGHEFAQTALDMSASAAVVRCAGELQGPCIVVDDTLLAFGRIGARARGASDATFLAVTGSAGKTTTKDILGSIVALDGPSLVAPGTENNEIGVPRLLLQLTPEHRYCVLELAMRGPGEIAYLADICRPQIGLITNVGEAHIGRLGSREAIAEAKAELLRALPEDGTAVLNADDFFFGLFMEMAPCPVVSFGLDEAPTDSELHVTAGDVKARGLRPARFELRLGDESLPVSLQVPGLHNVRNALAAAAAATAAGIAPSVIKAGIESYAGSPMRTQIIQAPGGYTIINDAYNASPTSTPEAVKLLGQCEGRRIFVFGDMLELGAGSERAHRDIGKMAAHHGVDWLITVGELAAVAAEEADLEGVQANAVVVEGLLHDA